MVGGGLGYLACALLTAFSSVLPGQAHEAFVDGMLLLAAPIAYLLSFVTGWPMQAEPAMFLFMVAMPANFIVVGMIGGWVVPRWRW